MDGTSGVKTVGQHETDNSGDESNASDWYIRDGDGLDEDDIELIKNTSETAFGFETDHMALKGNLDYHNLIKTVALLEAQRIKTIEDIEKLEKLRRTVKANPREYLNKFLSGDTSDIPARIEVAKIQNISLKKLKAQSQGTIAMDLDADFNKERFKFKFFIAETYKVPAIDWSKYRVTTSTNPTVQTNSPSGSFTGNAEEDATRGLVDDDLDKLTVRGRVYDQSKPQTFNQLWTAEEQMRLEELLIEYPPEQNENSRWRKIAQALGNRTTKQVCSRVQKYFKKLTKAGLPIPGHQLKSNSSTSGKTRRRKKRAGRNSTFFPTQHLGAPLLLDRNCEQDEEIKSELSTFTREMKEAIIKKVIGFKKKDAQLSPYSHPGIKCAGCCELPLCGTRWRCLVCPGVSLCSDCVIDQLQAVSPLHPPSHPLESLANPSLSHWDPDYTPDSFLSTNYLDPNFITTNVV